MTTKSEELFNQIMDKVTILAIAWYIKEEVAASLKYLHWYKLKNIEKNISIFCEYLEYLNTQNSEKITTFMQEKPLSWKVLPKDLSYFFVSWEPLSKEEETLYLRKISDNWYELLTLIQGMKWILVLSIDEFCNASKTRIDIHQLLMEEKKEKHSKAPVKHKSLK